MTSRPGTPPAERKRQQRERDRQPLLFVRDDWQLFLDPATLGQKVGAQPQYLRQVVLRELVDNGLDAGAQVTLNQGEGGWIISDSGPGLDPAAVPRLFAVNRPLMSSKRRRLPLRGMLGHGLRAVMGAVAASEGSLAVETRGRRLTLAVDLATGTTIVVDDQPIPDAPGLVVYLTFGPRLPPRYSYDDNRLARYAIQLAEHGTTYDGPSSPWWFSSRDLHQLMQQVSPIDTTVGRFCEELGFTLEDDRICRTLDRADATAVLNQLRQGTKPVAPKALGALGRGVYGDDYSYACHTGFTSERDAQIPYVVEAWAHCERPEKRGNGSAAAELLSEPHAICSNDPCGTRTPTAWGYRGAALGGVSMGPKTGDYQIVLGIITPHVDLGHRRQGTGAVAVQRSDRHGAAQGMQRGAPRDGQATGRHELQGSRVAGNARRLPHRQQWRDAARQCSAGHVRGAPPHPGTDRQGKAGCRLFHTEAAAGLSSKSTRNSRTTGM